MKEKVGLSLIIIVTTYLLLTGLVAVFSSISLYIGYVTTVIVYLVISILMLIENRNLQEFNIDRLSIFILILSSFFRRRLGIENEWYFLFIIGLAGVLLFVSLVLNWRRLPKTNFKWLTISIITALIILIPITLIEFLQKIIFIQVNEYNAPSKYGLLLDILQKTIYNLSFNAPIEEILFRAFLWGYLKKMKWDSTKIFLTQGGLFWVSHIGKIVESPLTFFISIPILTYTVSKLAKESQQISPSIISHLIVNTLSSILLTYIAS